MNPLVLKYDLFHRAHFKDGTMVHIRNDWTSHTTQHFSALQKGQFNEHMGWRKWNENRANMRIRYPGLWDLILLQVTKRHNVKQKCAVKSWFAIHLLYSGKYYKGDVTYCTEWKVTFGKQDIWYLYESTFHKIIWLGIWFNLYKSKFQFGVFIIEIN